MVMMGKFLLVLLSCVVLNAVAVKGAETLAEQYAMVYNAHLREVFGSDESLCHFHQFAKGQSCDGKCMCYCCSRYGVQQPGKVNSRLRE
jgi:hypothetical protein